MLTKKINVSFLSSLILGVTKRKPIHLVHVHFCVGPSFHAIKKNGFEKL